MYYIHQVSSRQQPEHLLKHLGWEQSVDIAFVSLLIFSTFATTASHPAKLSIVERDNVQIGREIQMAAFDLRTFSFQQQLPVPEKVGMVFTIITDDTVAIYVTV